MGVYSENKSLKEAHKKKKSLEQLTAENAELRAKLQNTEKQVTEAQLALCDVYELMLGGGATNG